MLRRALAGVVLAFGLAAPAVGRADPDLTPPRPAHRFEVPYPAGGQGDAEVVAHLSVDASGAVTEVEVVRGAEPFAGEVRRAAAKFRFEPARRAGRAVPSKVPFAITFDGDDRPAPTGPVPPVPAPVVPATDAPLEVTVHGDAAPAPGSTSLDRTEIEQLPGAFGDPFRAIEVLPGITPIASGVPYFFVRGAPPGNVGYTLDDIPVPLLFHVGAGPGVIHPVLVERVDFHPGGYPARYGRFSGGLVTAETRDPRPEWNGQAQIRAFDAGGLVEAPWADGRGTALVAGRYSYTAAILSLVDSDVDLGYWDYQGRVTYDLTPRDRVTVFGFGSGDRLIDESVEPDAAVFDGTFHRIDLRYDRMLPKEGEVGVRVLFGYDRSATDRDSVIEDRKLGTRMRFRQPVSDAVVWNGGADVWVDDYETQFGNFTPGGDFEDDLDGTFSALFPSRTDVVVGVWTDTEIELTKGATLVPGVRVDVYQSEGDGAIGVDPRLALRAAGPAELTFVPAFGIAHQLPGFLPGPGFQVAGIEGGLQQSIQSSFGVERPLPFHTFGRVTVFRNVTFDLNDPIGGTRGAGLGPTRFTQRTTGSTVGLEFFLRRPLTRTVGGLVSYTLSRSTRTYDGETVLSAFDRTHVVSAALAYDLGEGWTAGTRALFYSGFPEDEFNVFQPRLEDPPRTLPFFRFDFRVAKEWHLTERLRIALALEMLNAFFRREVLDVECFEEGCRSRPIGPVTIPSLGVELTY